MVSGAWEARGISPPRRHGIWLDCMWEFGTNRGVEYCDRRWLRIPGATAVYRWHWSRWHAHGKPWSAEVTLAGQDADVIPAWEATLECGHLLCVFEPTIGRKHVCPHCQCSFRVTDIRRGPGLREVTGRG